MTYLHAIQYLFDVSADSTPRSETEAAYAAYRAALGSGTHFRYLLFRGDRQGRLCATYCRGVLMAAGLHVGEVVDREMGEADDAVRIDGIPVSPATLRELCHEARACEQKLLRVPARTPGTPPEGGEAPSRRVAFSAAQRCGAVLPRLFEDAGCRVVLLIGRIDDPRLSLMARSAPESTVAVLSTADDTAINRFPHDTAEVVCPTCGSETFRRITDVCSHTGSRLTLTATSQLAHGAATPFSRSFRYRTLPPCSLRCGAPAASRAAMLAAEAMLTLRRLGTTIADEHISQGLSGVIEPLFFEPLSVYPPIIAHAVHTKEDVEELRQALSEHAATLPPPYRIVCDASVSSTLQAALEKLGTLIPIPQDRAELHPTHEQQTESDPQPICLLVGKSASLRAIISQHTQRLRRF